jgi:hypothetical protein
MKERVDRERMMLALIANGASVAEQDVLMADEFGMSKGATTQLRYRMTKQLREHASFDVPYYKSTAIARVHGHIAKAVANKAWHALAGLERILMALQGTAVPVVVKQEHTGIQKVEVSGKVEQTNEVNVNVTVRDAVTRALLDMSHSQLQALTTEGVGVHEANPELPPTLIEHAVSLNPSVKEADPQAAE